MNKKSLATLIIAQILLIGVLSVIASNDSDEVLYQSNENNLALNECRNCDKSGDCILQTEIGCNTPTSCNMKNYNQCRNDCYEENTCQQYEKQQKKCGQYNQCSNINLD